MNTMTISTAAARTRSVFAPVNVAPVNAAVRTAPFGLPIRPDAWRDRALGAGSVGERTMPRHESANQSLVNHNSIASQAVAPGNGGVAYGASKQGAPPRGEPR